MKRTHPVYLLQRATGRKYVLDINHDMTEANQRMEVTGVVRADRSNGQIRCDRLAPTTALVATACLLAAAGCSASPAAEIVGRWAGDCISTGPGIGVPTFPLILDLQQDGTFTTNAAAGFGRGGQYELIEPFQLRLYDSDPDSGLIGDYAVSEGALTVDMRAVSVESDIAFACNLRRS